jgi:MFS transporter, ACS family, allantoate permease
MGGAVAWKLLQIDTGVLNHWQTQFIIPGVITIAFGILCFFIVPASPSEAWFLTKAERIVAMQRISTNKTGTVSYKFEMYQLVEALRDPRLYCVALAVLTAGGSSPLFISWQGT